jgi:glutamyl-tRNA reductase
MEANLAKSDSSLMVIGLNHHTTPVEVREKLAFSEGMLHHALPRLVAARSVQEGAIVSTCNRVEVVAWTQNPREASQHIKTFLAQEQGLPLQLFEAHLYIHTDREAIRHVFRVASSLDSLVVGEPQILGQIKDAYTASASLGTLGTVLHRWFHKAFSVAKRVRSETGIAAKSVSVSSVAVELACRIFDQLNDKTAMVIGVGEMSQQTIRHLQANAIGTILITNRTFQRAVELASTCAGTVVPFEQFPKQLHLADVVIGSAGGSAYHLTSDLVQEALHERKRRPMFLIDLGVPRNFDPRLNNLENVFLYDIDDLEQIVADHKGEREAEAAKAEAIVTEEVEAFWQWYSSRDISPTIVALRHKAEAMRRREVEKTLAGLKDCSPETRRAIEGLSASLMNKLLHPPIGYLKNRSRNGDGQEGATSVTAVRQMFGLDDRED